MAANPSGLWIVACSFSSASAMMGVALESLANSSLTTSGSVVIKAVRSARVLTLTLSLIRLARAIFT
jgi:hypothetical protein